MISRFFVRSFLFALLSVGGFVAYSNTVIWNSGAYTGDWGDPSSWQSGAVPEIGDEAFVRYSGNAKVTDERQVGGLLIGCDASQQNAMGTVTILEGGNLEVSKVFHMGGRITEGSNTGKGILNIDGGTFSVNVNSTSFVLGVTEGSTAEINVNSGKLNLNTNGDLVFGGNGGWDNLTYMQQGGVANIGSLNAITHINAAVGITGGTMNVSSRDISWINLGDNVSTSFTVSGGNLNFSTPLYSYDSNILLSDNGTISFSGNNATLGESNDSRTTITIMGGVFNASPATEIQAANATVNISGGRAIFSTERVMFGARQGNYFQMNVSGGDVILGGENTAYIYFGTRTATYTGGKVEFVQTGGNITASTIIGSGNGLFFNSVNVGTTADTVATFKFLGGTFSYTAGSAAIYLGDSGTSHKTSTQLIFGKSANVNFDTEMVWRKDAQIVFALDGVQFDSDKNSDYNPFNLRTLTLQPGDGGIIEGQIYFILDAAGLGSQENLVSGDVVQIALMNFTSGSTTHPLASSINALIANSKIQNVNSSLWEDVYLSYDYPAGTIFFNGTYIPEPSDFAAAFGILAFFAAAFRAYKKGR